MLNQTGDKDKQVKSIRDNSYEVYVEIPFPLNRTVMAVLFSYNCLCLSFFNSVPKPNELSYCLFEVH